ncbi:MAG TPA: glycosyltransferase family 9 protein [Methylophilaceae bacterium]|nr:glycosyltransferase family 9 protein [Methylophilaceae bacterium]
MFDRHVYSPLPDVRSIVVLRPNAIGDFMFALPALHALRQTYPKAKIVLLGKQWHADFLNGRPGPVDKVIVMPPVPGVGAPIDSVVDPERNRRFVAAMREAQFDLAIQMYGGGRYSNAYTLSLGARLTIGLKTPDAAQLDRWLPYSEIANRRLELLQVAALAGAVPVLRDSEITITENDRQEAARVMPPMRGERIVILHPGATDVRRHWPAERFAAVGDRLASKGATIVISATGAEAHLAHTIVNHMEHQAINLTDQLSLPALCGLLERAVMMVSNDTGPLHLALAIGTPAVGIFWLTNLLESGPIRQDLLRPALSVQAHCPVCGVSNLKHRCEHDVCFVDDVSLEKVAGMASELFDEAISTDQPVAGVPASAPHLAYYQQGPRHNGAGSGQAVPNA